MVEYSIIAIYRSNGSCQGAHWGASLVISESALSLSSAFLHQALLHDLLIQTYRDLAHRLCRGPCIESILSVQQELMRHADIRTTMNVYGKAMDESKRKAHGKVVRLVLPSKVA